MPINLGARFDHYEIIGSLGAGGMGEVYLARDTKLDREVALKILPADLALNRDRMERFVREAKSTAALNHPHIAHVYEIGSCPTTASPDGQPGWVGAVSEGADAGLTTDCETHFIAMEYIDGVTLREKIHRERTELPRLLRFMQQVAEGLSKAHGAGIVHRDLKPDNIMITRDGFAKVLDFGLAKLVEKVGPGLGQSEGSDAPTEVMQQHSVPGMIMGTVGYMSPEQAQGKTNEIDQRSDIFSFGCILFEAITGKKPFEGESVIKSLHSLIYEPAPQIKDLNPSAPAELQRIVRRCLEKDADDRYQTIKEVAIELRHLRRELADAIETRAGSSFSSAERASAQVGSDKLHDSLLDSSLQTELLATPSTQTSSVEYVVTGIKRHRLAAFLSIVVVVVAIGGFALYRYASHTAAPIESIAVMPFVNESGNADVEYLSDGMTETLISSLSQLPNLNVKARSSVFRYKSKATDAKTIGKELNVQAILNGRVVQRGNQLTLSLELVDAQTENVIWSEQYNRKQTDLVLLQSEIARDVSSKLRVKLSGADKQKVAKKYTDNAEAYKLYLQGRFYWNKRTGEALQKSIEYFNQAIEKDPTYALAYAGLADAYAILPSYSQTPSKEAYPKAKSAATKALEIDDNLAEARTSLALVKFWYDWSAGAEPEFKRAIELNPNYATAHHWYSLYLSAMGRHSEAIAEMKRAQELDPFSIIINTELGLPYLYARQYDQSVEQFKKAIEMDPNFAFAHFWLAEAYDRKGRYEEADAEHLKALALGREIPQAWSLMTDQLKEAFKASREKGYWQKRLELTKKLYEQGAASTPAVAGIFAILGDKDQAFAWLEKSYQQHEGFLLFINTQPEFDGLHSDPRYADLVRRIGFHQ